MNKELIAEIRDVLRPFAEFLRWSDAADEDEVQAWHDNQGVARRRIVVGDLRAAKRLYDSLLSRIEAQGEDIHALTGTADDQSDLGVAIEALAEYERDGGVSLDDLKQELNQEGGDAAAPQTDRPGDRTSQAAFRPHVAPPASADHGSGRATGSSIVEAVLGYGKVFGLKRGHWFLIEFAIREINEALASEYSRGEAAGRLSGIEEAAKVAEGFWPPRRGAIDPAKIAAAIRSLLTNETKPEIDPNAWAFKHGLEST